MFIFSGQYLTIQRDSTYGVWAVNEIDIVTPFTPPDVDQNVTMGGKLKFCDKEYQYYIETSESQEKT